MLNGRVEPPGQWETLDVHAARVATRARSFAEAFGAGDWGELLGLWHDQGKRSEPFQHYIGNHPDDADASEELPGTGRVDHATFGARHAARAIPNVIGQMLAFCIAGHHAGFA